MQPGHSLGNYKKLPVEHGLASAVDFVRSRWRSTVSARRRLARTTIANSI